MGGNCRLTCSLNLESQEGLVVVDSKVRSASLIHDKIFVGVEFLNLEEAGRRQVESYVQKMRDYAPD